MANRIKGLLMPPNAGLNQLNFPDLMKSIIEAYGQRRGKSVPRHKLILQCFGLDSVSRICIPSRSVDESLRPSNFDDRAAACGRELPVVKAPGEAAQCGQCVCTRPLPACHDAGCERAALTIRRLRQVA